jgi:hypothetical protein
LKRTAHIAGENVLLFDFVLLAGHSILSRALRPQDEVTTNRKGDGVLEPISKLSDVPLFHKGFIFNRNEIVNQNGMLDPVAPFSLGNMLCVTRDSPWSAK